MLNRLQIIEERYNKIQEMLQDGEIVKDVKKMTSLMKEMRSLEKIVEKYHDYRDTSEQIKELKIMAKDSDPEISEMAEAELANAEVKLPKLEEELKILLLPKDPNDEKNVIFEIRGAAGGDEGNIFAGDLFRMYTRYAESRGWKVEVLSAEEADLGGFSKIEFMVEGDNV